MANELKKVRFLAVDDAGDNFALEKRCKRQNLNVKFEFTGPWSLQRNERKFQTLYERIRAIFNDAGVEGGFRKGLWAECASSATYYENTTVSKDKKKLPLELMFKEKTKELKGLNSFGEMCVLATKVKIQGTLNVRGTDND